MNFIRPALSRTTAAGPLRIHYLDWPGPGIPIVLLHPNRTNARVWDFVVEFSALSNRYIAPDARGHGLSDYPARGYLYNDYLGDLRALLDALKVPQAHVVGAATGGNLALLLASTSPDLVASLTVIDPGLSLDPVLSARVREQMVREYRFESLAQARDRMPFSDLWSNEMKDHYSHHSFRPVNTGGVEWRYYPAGVVETEHSLETPIWDQIDVRCRTLIVRGANSAVFPRENMTRLAGLIPGARTLEIPGADHRVSQDNPHALAEALDAFIVR